MNSFDILDFSENDPVTGLNDRDFRFNDVGSSIPVQDVTDDFLVNENLPKGDFRINFAEAIDVSSDTTSDYGEIVSGLSDTFSSDLVSSIVTNLITDAMTDAITDAITNAIEEYF